MTYILKGGKILIDKRNISRTHKEVEKMKERFLEAGFEAKVINGIEVLEKTWSKEVEVAFHGKMESTYKVSLILSGKTLNASFYKNGRLEKIKEYKSIARGFNAIIDTVEYAGFEF